MTDYDYQPLDFPGILAHGWRLTLRTLLGAGLPALLLLLPVGMAVGHYARQVFSGLALLIERHGLPIDTAPSEEFIRDYMALSGPIIFYIALICLYIVGMIYIQTITTKASWEAIAGRSPGIAEGLRNSFDRTFWRNLLQTLLLGIIAAITYLAGTILLQSGQAIGPMFEAIPMVAMYGATFYFAVATVFRVHELVVDGRGPWKGLIASMALVRGHWWKVSSVVMLIILVGIVLTILLPRLTGSGTLYQHYVTPDMSPSGGNNPEVIAAMYVALFKDIAGSITIVSTLIQSITIPLVLIFGINLLTAKYVDLRVRRGDFDDEEVDPDVEIWKENE